MYMADAIFTLFFVICILDLTFVAIFCRVMKKKEVDNIDWKLNGRNTEKRYTYTEQEKSIKQISIKTKVKKALCGIWDHYGYGLMRYTNIVCGKIPSHRIRKFLYRHVFMMNITGNTIINGGCEIRSPWNLYADKCIIMSGCILDARSGIKIGQDVVFGTGVHIWTEEHDINDPLFAVNIWNKGPVIIGDRAWICSDSTILPATIVGAGAVVASRACVTKDCQAYTVYGGIPAKKISERNEKLMYELSEKPHWHFY